jgi:aspartyl-tRNA(Asn)/glutamyl-tRNA(Gln) amidotransferase subunit B
MIDAGEINRKVGKQVFEEIFKKDVEPAAYVEEHGLKSMNDEGALRATIEEIVANNPQSVEDYNAGKKKAIGFLVGQTMRATKGKADPGMVNKILAEILNK